MADFLKEVFEDKAITFEEFEKKVSEKGLNIADLSTGGYVGKDKFNAEVNKHKASLDTLKKQYDELAGAVDGDSGLKQQVETLKTEKQDYENKFNQTFQELTQHKNVQAVLKAGVIPEMSEYVSYEVGKLTDETVDFNTALKGFIQKNTQFIKPEPTSTGTRIRTSPKLDGDDAKKDGDVNSQMNTALLKASGRA